MTRAHATTSASRLSYFSSITVVARLVLTDAIPFSIALELEYISLLPMV